MQAMGSFVQVSGGMFCIKIDVDKFEELSIIFLTCCRIIYTSTEVKGNSVNTRPGTHKDFTLIRKIPKYNCWLLQIIIF